MSGIGRLHELHMRRVYTLVAEAKNMGGFEPETTH
jgi:hypothetical protein